MNKKKLATAAALSLCAGALAAGAASPQKPNVIYIYFDDLGYGELGCYGQEKIRTPNIDRVAAEGMRFTRHYTTFPVSAPARCGLMTGRHSGHAHVRGNYEFGGHTDDEEGGNMPLPEGSMTIARVMKQAGYATAAIGKWGLGFRNTSGDPLRHGFDYFYGYYDQKQAQNHYPTHLWENGNRVPLKNKPIRLHSKFNLPPNAPDSDFDAFTGEDYSLDRMVDKTLGYIKANKDRPFFLYLPYTPPHVSLQCKKEAIAEYIGQFPEETPYLKGNYVPSKHPLSTYAAMITHADKQVGKILALLKELGLDENTIVMISSDNGATANQGGAQTEFFDSTGGLRGRKRDLYEGGIRIPFIVRWPGKVAKGSVCDLVSAQYDMLATLGELTGARGDWETDGISILPTLLGAREKQTPREYLYFEFTEKTGQIAIIKDGRWKGVKSNMHEGPGTWEIFDLHQDREEQTDLSARHSEMINRFEQIITNEHWQPTLREWEFINPKFLNVPALAPKPKKSQSKTQK
ncbi:arylsulfatase A [Ereboglobus sp. PH5-5]|uniref:arylsulfatase n=1 Tax=unclassified Ereboglobus TaxID=2626932 RepID=UPI002406D2EE|nr:MULTISPECIES: arylsulfatase [unclassified Ereboglobus]MDF9827145.1 arylsulfatase A [Ereboglobus sp. PH5-10]MDF9832564.1 arylsulfatase A [Ereboglobus sp. PH5-5]